MLKVVLIGALILVGASASATHIVGGEFEILHIEGDRYLFRQIQYFDVINGTPEAKDQVIDASIFRKSDNVFVTSVVMLYQSEQFVPYTNPQCTDDRLVTNRIVYSAEVQMNPALFSDPQGYYMVWERCCRNNIITNIVSPDRTGQTFYIEFPPIRKDGQVFRNSSPQLFPPLSDYACVNRFYYVDFRGYDPDGDSLVYSLATQFNTSEYEPLPIPTPAPHPLVTWISGISADYQIPGNPTLQVNAKGFLTVTPSQEGLFVFSVKCEEFRDGEKIGEVVRDFQLFVIDCPDPGNPPEITVRAPESNSYQSELDTLVLKVGDDRCFDFKVTDKDGSETITLKAEAVNFEASIQSILSAEIGYLQSPDDTMNVRVCLPECPYLLDEPFVIDIIARDFTCPLPLMDTMRLIVLVEPPPNKPPVFVEPAQETLTLTYLEGDEIDLSFSAIDEDLDSLLFELVTEGFDLAAFGIEIDTVLFEDGRLDLKLNWNTDCRVYPFAMKNEFQLKMYVDDADKCGIDNRDSILVNINIVLPSNNAPEVLVNNENHDKEYTVRVDDMLVFDVRAIDGDPTDQLTLEAIGQGFDLAEAGIIFENQSGTSNIGTEMSWSIGCDAVDAVPEGKYEILLIAEDADKCKVPNADTTRIILNVLPPINRAPEISINNSSSGDTVYVDAGMLLDLDILAFDLDDDSISLELINPEFARNFGITFDAKSGKQDLYSPFEWQTDCSLLGENFSDGIYNFTLLANDYKCLVPKSDTLALTVVIHDEEIDYDILPPNVFTPNSEDDINMTYYIPDLPADNCRRQFKEVVIVNRYGKKVFSSNQRDFRWRADDQPTGVYYYLVSYSDFSFKGTLSLLR